MVGIPRLLRVLLLSCLPLGTMVPAALGTVLFPDYVIDVDPPTRSAAGGGESVHLRILVRNELSLDEVRLAGAAGTPGFRLEPTTPLGGGVAPEGYRIQHYLLSGPVSSLPTNLALEFKAGGIPVREPFVATTPVSAAPPIRVTEEVARIDPTRFRKPGPARSAEPVAAQPGPTSSPRTVSVSGRIVFRAPDGALRGVDGATVKIMERGGLFGDNMLAEWVTDVNGDVDYTLIMDGTQDVYIKIQASNGDAVNVGTGLFFSTYTRNIDIGPFSGTLIDFGTARWTDDFNEALYVTHAITRAHRYCLDAGFMLSRINVRYPDDSQGVSWYSPLAGTEGIHLRSDRVWRTDTIYHEYGHHFVYQEAGGGTPWYCNGLCEPDVGCGHCYWCEENDQVAWFEGFPTFLGWTLKRQHAADFGWWLPDFGVHDEEIIQVCDDKGTIERGLTTEGIFCSFLIDLVDGSNENDPAFDSTSPDRTAFSPDVIFHVATVLRPGNSRDFVRMMGEYLAGDPGFSDLDVSDYWSTARNNGLVEDTVSPTAPTSVSSTTHPVGVASSSNMPQLFFGGGTDDYTGVQGHYATMTPNNPATPDESGTESPGGFMTWPTPLAPGTWYANVRSVDGAGNRSLDHISYGPIEIAPPLPVDLAPTVNYLWENPIVVRNTPDATTTAAGFPAELLPGNAYLNLFLANLSSSGASSDTFRVAMHVSGSLAEMIYLTDAVIAANEEWIFTNMGPRPIRGGRHRITVNIDPGEKVAEIDEENNRYGVSVVVRPDALPIGSWQTFPPPPSAEDGLALSPDTPNNMAGHRITPSQPYTAVVLEPLDVFYDPRYVLGAFQPSTGPLDGLENPLAVSTVLDGLAGLVLATSASATGVFDLGVEAEIGRHDYRLRAVDGVTRPLTSTTNLSWTENDWVSLLQFDFGPGDLGYFNFTVTADFDSLDDRQPLRLFWIDEADSVRSLTYGYDTSVYNGFATRDVTVGAQGTYALAVVRSNFYGTTTGAAITVATHRSPLPEVTIPEVDPKWPAAFLPTPMFSQDDTLSFPTELLGEASSTYINFAVQNLGSGWTQPIPVSLYVGSEEATTFNLGSIAPGGRLEYRHPDPFWIRGGRRVLALMLDPYQALPELSETNNLFAMQWGWTGTTIFPGQPIVRPRPPLPDLWDGYIPILSGDNPAPDGEDGPGDPLNFVVSNCDGLRLDPSQAGSGINWHGVAAMPYGQDDIDLRLFQGGLPPAEMYVHSLSGSHTVGPESEFALLNLGAGAAGVFDVGIYNTGGGIEDYAVQAAAATPLGAITGSSNLGSFGLAPGMILNLYEVDLIAGTYDFDVAGTNQNVMLGVSVHPPRSVRQSPWQGKDDLQNGVRSGRSAAPGAVASVTVEVAPGEEGVWCVAVWKVGVADLLESAGYDLFGTGVPSAPLCAAIDGTLDPGYGAPLAVQTNPTGFGDSSLGLPDSANGSELDAAYGKIADGNLYLMFTGNLESNYNDLEIFLDTTPGGQNRILGAQNPNVDGGALQRLGDDGSGNGLTFDLGFEADVYVTVSCGGDPVQVYAHGAVLGNPDDGGVYLGSTTPASGGILYGTPENTSNGGVRITLDNSNVAGVFDVEEPSADPGAVTTGIEVLIPLNVIGNPDCVRVTAFINGAGHDWVSNQFLPPLPPGTGNLVEPRNVNLSVFAGAQYFDVCAPDAVGIDNRPTVAGPHRLMHPPVPNPYAATTTLSFTLPQREVVDLSVFDVQGRLVRRLVRKLPYSDGTHTVTWDGRDDAGVRVRAGVYLARFAVGDIEETRRMVLTP